MIGFISCTIRITRKFLVITIPVSILFTFYSCSDPEVKPDQLTAYQREVIDYFVDVTLGFEFGSVSRVTRKWKTEVKVFIGGDKSNEMLNELDRIIAELEGLTELTFSITQDTLQSNFYIYLGTATGFVQRIPFAQPHVASNWGLFYVYFNGSNEIYSAVMYVDTQRATQANARKHLLREEFTQALGLARDSNKYPQSIFFQQWSTTTEYAPIDRDIIRLLYHPSVITGMNEAAVRNLLKNLVKELEIGV
ncbi:MAG: DUF2927 domain-containing protein [Cyclobacteriaceae bacterium]|nr:DUF2927 domain-containing protein [Cyclobacteriaceae bacterium]UYN86028.1 MAG: DUF2927 domain-containing protein [Cyclobacteriaceae bacterium]